MQRVRDSWDDEGEEPSIAQSINQSNKPNYAQVLRKPGSNQNNGAVNQTIVPPPSQSTPPPKVVNHGSLKILRREPKASDQSNSQFDTSSNAERSAEAALLQRQREYEEARAKIFGTSEPNSQSSNQSNGRGRARPNTAGMITLPLTQPTNTYAPPNNQSNKQSSGRSSPNNRQSRQSPTNKSSVESYQSYQSVQALNQYQTISQTMNPSFNQTINPPVKQASFYQPSSDVEIDRSLIDRSLVDRSLMNTFSPSVFTPGIPWAPKGR